jgi:hypothetical protein
MLFDGGKLFVGERAEVESLKVVIGNVVHAERVGGAAKSSQKSFSVLQTFCVPGCDGSGERLGAYCHPNTPQMLENALRELNAIGPTTVVFQASARPTTP